MILRCNKCRLNFENQNQFVNHNERVFDLIFSFVLIQKSLTMKKYTKKYQNISTSAYFF